MEINNDSYNLVNSLKEKLFLEPNFFGAEIELEEKLISTGIVELEGKPSSFVEVEDDDFYSFIMGRGIPTNFVGIEDKDFNARTKELLDRLNELDDEEEQKLFARLIEYLIYDKYWLILNSDDDRINFSNVIKEHKNEIPIKNMGGEYTKNNDDSVILFDEKIEVRDEFKKFFIEQKKDKHYNEYVEALGVKSPKEFVHSIKWFEKININFVKYLYRLCEEEVGYENELLSYLKIKLGSEERKYALDFIFDYALLEKKHEWEAYLLLRPDELINYGEKINNLYRDNDHNKNCIELVGYIDKNGYNDIISEIINEILEELKFADNEKVERIKNDLKIENMVLCVSESKQKPVGYTVLADDKIYLWHQSNHRKYRECIIKYIGDKYEIKLDTRSYSMSAIDMDSSIEVADVDQNDLDELLAHEIEWNKEEIDVKKRILMEPYYFKKKFYPGYAKTCPLCNKLVVTEITSMRIKSIYIKEEETKYKYDFICCNTCADLFYYCENQPVIKGLDEIGNFNSEIQLEFYFEPHYRYTPYEISFKPRPVHRNILLRQKKGSKT